MFFFNNFETITNSPSVFATVSKMAFLDPCRQLRRFLSFFLKMVAICYLGFVVCMFESPLRAFAVFYCGAKFDCNQCSSLDNMKVLIFTDIGLKMTNHAPKRRFWGFDPVNGQHYQRRPKRHILLGKRVTQHIIKIGLPVTAHPLPNPQIYALQCLSDSRAPQQCTTI